jgi:hypothetical protein
MAEIFTACGKRVLIDDADLAAVSRYRWHVGSRCYIRASTGRQGRHVTLHTMLMGTPAGMVVDHINGDTLDNRRANLRVCTVSDNLKNRKRSKANRSGFKGVYRAKRGGWVAEIKSDRMKYRLGYFPSAELAHEAYCAAAKRLHGPFARLT